MNENDVLNYISNLTQQEFNKLLVNPTDEFKHIYTKYPILLLKFYNNNTDSNNDTYTMLEKQLNNMNLFLLKSKVNNQFI